MSKERMLQKCAAPTSTKSSTVVQFHYLILRLILGVQVRVPPKVRGPYKHEIVDSCNVSQPHNEAHSRCQSRGPSRSVRPPASAKSSTGVQFHYLILRFILGVKVAVPPKVCCPYKHEIVDSCTVSIRHTETHSRCQSRGPSKSVRPLQTRNRRQLHCFTTSY